MNEATLRSHWRALQSEHPELRLYRLELGRGVKVFGTCSYRTKTIKVSKHHLRESPDELVLNTLRHEAAHALAGRGTGHGWKWKREAVKLGAKPIRCHSETLEVTQRRAVGYYTCDASCGAKQMLVVKKPRYDASNYRCGRCKSTVTYHPTEEHR